MAKKKEGKKSNKKNDKAKGQDPKKGVPMQMPPGMPPLSKEAQEKLDKIKAKLEKLQKAVVDKFGKYIVGVALLPPPRPKEGEKPPGANS